MADKDVINRAKQDADSTKDDKSLAEQAKRPENHGPKDYQRGMKIAQIEKEEADLAALQARALELAPEFVDDRIKAAKKEKEAAKDNPEAVVATPEEVTERAKADNQG